MSSGPIDPRLLLCLAVNRKNAPQSFLHPPIATSNDHKILKPGIHLNGNAGEKRIP